MRKAILLCWLFALMHKLTPMHFVLLLHLMLKNPNPLLESVLDDILVEFQDGFPDTLPDSLPT